MSADEAQLQRSLHLLKSECEAGRVKRINGMSVADALKTVRFAQDGSVDLSSVSPYVRDMARAVAALHEREEGKPTFTLAQIQETYFDFLDMHFGDFHKLMRARNLTPSEVAAGLSAAPESVEPLAQFMPAFLETIGEFWAAIGAVAIEQAARMGFLEKESTVRVIDDPFLGAREVFVHGTETARVHALVLHALEMLELKEAACASPPRIVILPDLGDVTA